MAAKRKERRGGERRRCRVRIKFWNDEIEASGFTADISSRGLFVETSKTLSVGTRLHLELELETGSFYAEAVVARALNAPRTAQPVVQAGLGLRLMDITEAIRAVAEQELLDKGLELDLRDLAKLATVYVRDIKRGGLFVPAEKPPDRDTSVTVRLLLPEPHEPIEIRGVVIHVMDNPSGVAINLLDVDQIRGKLASIITG